MRRFELTNEQWKMIEPALPRQARGGRWNDHRQTLGGTLDRILARLRARIDRDGLIDWDTWCVDASNIRASKAAAGASKKTGPMSPPTTHSADPEGDSGPRSIWFVVGAESPSASSWRRVRPMSRNTSRTPSRR